jgi:hypothetical protein
MSAADRLQFRTLAIGVALVVLTALAIYVVYGSLLFRTWPWFRFSLLMSLLTCLWTFTSWFGRVTGGNDTLANPYFFAFCVVPFDLILLYPGTDALGIYSDGDIYPLLFTLAGVHGAGFYLIEREIKAYLQSTRTDYSPAD